MFGLVPWRETEKDLPLMNLRNEFKTLYDRLVHGWPVPFEPILTRERVWGLELEETDKELIVRAELPGFESEEVEVHLRNNELLLKAAKKIEAKDKEKEPKAAEYRRYERLVMLPVEIDPEKVEALYRNGVLEIHLPRKESTMVKIVPARRGVAPAVRAARLNPRYTPAIAAQCGPGRSDTSPEDMPRLAHGGAGFF